MLFLMAAPAKVCVTTRVVVGPKVLWTGGKLYDDSATVQVVVDAALARLRHVLSAASSFSRSGRSTVRGGSGAAWH